MAFKRVEASAERDEKSGVLAARAVVGAIVGLETEAHRKRAAVLTATTVLTVTRVVGEHACKPKA